jgi:type II secretory pathway pseudopilin PulG
MIPPHSRAPRGLTLVEVTVVIMVLLSLISTLFVGARAWKKSSDRAACIINIRAAQQMVRSYQNLNNRRVGQPINMQLLSQEFGLNDISNCPGGGEYEHVTEIPDIGVLAMTCSLAEAESHEPSDTESW